MPNRPKKDYQKIKKTYTTVETYILSVFSFISKWVDRILFTQKYGKLVAVCLATMICLIITTNDDTNLFKNSITSADKIGDVPVSANISSSEYEVTGLPKTVDVTITGDASDVQFASQQKDNYQVIADLTKLGEGRHEVELKPLNFSSKVDVTMSPSTASVTVRKKIAKSFTFSYDFINSDQMDKIYSLGKPEFESSEVLVKASEETMSQISYIKALIDVSGVKADFEQDARLVAYDYNGDKMEVDIIPKTVGVKVGVSSPRKEVPIKVSINGSLPDNKAVSEYTLDQTKMTIYGPQEILDEIDEVVVAIPVKNLKGNVSPVTVTVPIMLPDGVRKGSVSKVNVQLTLDDAKSKSFDNVPITVEGLAKGLTISEQDFNAVNIKLKGVSKILDKIDSPNIKIEADASKIKEAGEYTIELTVVDKNTLIKYELSETKITVKVNKGE